MDYHQWHNTIYGYFPLNRKSNISRCIYASRRPQKSDDPHHRFSVDDLLCPDAALAAKFLQAGLSIPMHYNTFDLIKVDPQVFAKKVEANGQRAKVLEIGETVEV